MELIKQNENYTIVDKTEQGWNVNGSATCETNGSLSFNINVITELGDFIGDFYYSKPAEENANIHVGYNVAEINRDALVAYSDTLIDWTLEQFKA